MTKVQLVAIVLLVLPVGAAPVQRTRPVSPVAVVNLRQAISLTDEGKNLIADLDAASQTRQEEIRTRRKELESLRARLSASGHLLSAAARNDLMLEIRRKERQLQRNIEDAEAEVAYGEQQILQRVGRGMLKVISDYGAKHGYELVLEASSPAIAWVAPVVDITEEVVRAYDNLDRPGPLTRK